MNSLDDLSELEQDAITEVFNIGIGKAAAALGEMVNKEVSLTVPKLTITTLEQANQLLQTDDREVSGVLERFDGAVAGNAILLFPQGRTLDLVRLLFPPDTPEEMLVQMEEDTLAEVGNIILNATLSALSDTINEELSNQIPQTFRGQVRDIIFTDDIAALDIEHVLKMDMEMTVRDIDDIHGDIAFLVIIKSIGAFKEKLAAYFGLA